MDFRAFLVLCPVVAGPGTAGGSRLQRPAVPNGGRGMGCVPIGQAEQHGQVVHDGLETAGLEPALHLLMHAQPGRQVVGQHPPRTACAHDIAKRIEHFAQIVTALAGIERKEDHIMCDERPFFVADIGGVGFAVGHSQRILRRWHGSEHALGLRDAGFPVPPASARARAVNALPLLVRTDSGFDGAALFVTLAAARAGEPVDWRNPLRFKVGARHQRLDADSV